MTFAEEQLARIKTAIEKMPVGATKVRLATGEVIEYASAIRMYRDWKAEVDREAAGNKYRAKRIKMERGN